MGFWKYSSGICGAEEGRKRMRKEKAGHVIDEMIKESIRKTGKKGGDENRGEVILWLFSFVCAIL